jgi:hypothetical protein
MAFEAVTPTTSPGKALHRAARRGVSAVLAPLRGSDPTLGRTLFAFYDLKVAPITFDFLWFLAGADLARRDAGVDNIHVVIVPGPHDRVRVEREDYENVIDPEARWLRVFNVLVPAMALLPTASGLTLAGSRREAARLRDAAMHFYPNRYEPSLPTYALPSDCLEGYRDGQTEIAVLRAPRPALEAVDRWLGPRLRGRRLVVLTMRLYRYMEARNSMLPEWAAFARSLDPEKWLPVIVPDTNQTLDPPVPDFAGIDVFGEAAWNLPLRMALYQRAYLNLGVNGGPMGLCWLNAETRYVTFRMLTPSVPQTTLEYMQSFGFEPGRSLPFATEFQRWLWEEPDQAAVIRREFDRMVATIERSGIDAAPPPAHRTAVTM